MNHTIFIAYYTPEYEETAKEYLIPSLRKFHLNFDVKAVPSLGSWYKNTAFKAKFVLDYLDYPFNVSVVLLDVDARIIKKPILFDQIPLNYDIALHYLDWNIHYGYNQNPPTKELLSGTIMLRNKPEVISLCKEWYKKANEGHVWEQKVLSNIIDERNDIEVYKLPREYCFPTTLPRGGVPPVPCDAVISHYQASRKFKRLIK